LIERDQARWLLFPGQWIGEAPPHQDEAWHATCLQEAIEKRA